jgi:uncharacterized protein (DUF433 family)
VKKNWKVFTLFTVLVFAIAFAGITAVFAQGPKQPAAPAGTGTGNQAQVSPGMGYRAVDEADMHAAIAEVLGISVETLEAEIAAGNTVYALADELGVDFADVRAAMVALHDAAMQQAIDNGAVPQYQANQGQQMGAGRMRQGGPAAGVGQANRGGGSGDCIYTTP